MLCLNVGNFLLYYMHIIYIYIYVDLKPLCIKNGIHCIGDIVSKHVDQSSKQSCMPSNYRKCLLNNYYHIILIVIFIIRYYI